MKQEIGFIQMILSKRISPLNVSSIGIKLEDFNKNIFRAVKKLSAV